MNLYTSSSSDIITNSSTTIYPSIQNIEAFTDLINRILQEIDQSLSFEKFFIVEKEYSLEMKKEIFNKLLDSLTGLKVNTIGNSPLPDWTPQLIKELWEIGNSFPYDYEILENVLKEYNITFEVLAKTLGEELPPCNYIIKLKDPNKQTEINLQSHLRKMIKSYTTL